MTILIGGKRAKAKPAVKRVGKHRQLDMQQIKQRHPADPFPPITVFQEETVEHRISVGCELKMWVEQRLDELVLLADDENWLRLQLREPAFLDHPDRPHAVKRLNDLQEQIAEIAGGIAYMEAHADRIWQSLDSDDREQLAGRWIAQLTDDRLILTTWKHIAPVGFRWPDYYRVDLQWFSHLSPVLIQDMKDAWPKEGLLLGVPHEWETPE